MSEKNEVPQWAMDAAKAIQQRTYYAIPGDRVAALIAKHAPTTPPSKPDAEVKWPRRARSIYSGYVVEQLNKGSEWRIIDIPNHAKTESLYIGASWHGKVGDYLIPNQWEELFDHHTQAAGNALPQPSGGEGLRELLGEALSVLRGDWSVLSFMRCAEKIRNKLSVTRS
ncbi:MAG: hypothetical protein E6R03_03690 [Hyphomicrobiaceae bacterium]|nr:MAG: hypothetical protein E6R03_03690 [Hyphomicrobiaceae bacterium]